MIHTTQISDTTAAAWAIVGAMTLVCTYITGYSRARRKYLQQVDNDLALVQTRLEYIQALEAGKETRDKLIESLKETMDIYKDMHRLDGKIITMWEGKYNTLQQEIECHIHETYGEVERPHIEQIWPVDKGNPVTDRGYQEYVDEHEETPAEKEKKAYWDAENDFWESLRRLHKEENN